MTEPLAFLNGRLFPQAQASLALNDAGFVYGATVTDLVRTFKHRLYRWPDHLARFRHGCAAADLAIPFDDDAVTHHANELVAHNASLIAPDADLALVLLATPGPVGFYFGQDVAANEQPTFAMHTFPLPFARYRSWIEEGVSLVTPSVRQVPANCVDPRIKQRSRMHWWLAEREVRRTHSGSVALLLDQDGGVTETASSNLLLVKDGTIVSPPRESILGGISLKVVSELCARLNVPFEFRRLTLDDCYAADEAFVTCTSYCLAGVRRINERPLGWPGPMLQQLVEAWSGEVGVEIHRQIVE